LKKQGLFIHTLEEFKQALDKKKKKVIKKAVKEMIMAKVAIKRT
jgi:hypothetical protein